MYMHLRVIYGKINPWTGHSWKDFWPVKKFVSPFTDPYECPRVVPSNLQITASYLLMLKINYELVIRKDSKKNPCSERGVRPILTRLCTEKLRIRRRWGWVGLLSNRHTVAYIGKRTAAVTKPWTILTYAPQ